MKSKLSRLSVTECLAAYRLKFKCFVSRTGIYVPMGFAAFPHELLHCPQAWARWRYKDIRSYSYMASGGHFAAFEEPKLLADDFTQFVKKVEGKKS